MTLVLGLRLANVAVSGRLSTAALVTDTFKFKMLRAAAQLMHRNDRSNKHCPTASEVSVATFAKRRVQQSWYGATDTFGSKR